MSVLGSQFAPQAQILPPPKRQALGVTLLRDGLVGSDDLVQALSQHHQGKGALADLLLAKRLVSPQRLAEIRARIWGLPAIDPALTAPDPRLIDGYGAINCLRHGILPWRDTGGGVVVIVDHPATFATHKALLQQIFGRVLPAIAPFKAIEACILNTRGRQLDHAAQTRVPEAESCRNWQSRTLPYWLGFAAILLLAAVLFAPLALLSLLTAWAVLTLILASALKTAAALAAFRKPAPEGLPPIIVRMPVVSVMVPLYREARIASRLIARLGRIDYPHDLLDILIVVEEDDQITRDALAQTALPEWMRIIVVPQGQLKTKPRALNHALDRCRGSIIGIYDAEDAPAPDQITKIVTRFHQRGSEVACLQGILDFYNPSTNWLSRCFTIEYAAWFRILLPGMARLGLAVPLGGTTLFFRRAALESLGAWDAHNVTEDADLGMRLARHGFRTELIGTVTGEEANCRTLPWIKQRSRWLKGYMMTYLVHMRAPRLLLRQLGWWKFLGFQTFFLTTLSQFLLTPVLLSFWIVPLGLSHPILDLLSPALATALFATFLWSEALLLGLGILAFKMTGHRISPLWALAQHLYFPLGALAAYKAFWELLVNPFYWDKTSHGLFDHE